MTQSLGEFPFKHQVISGPRRVGKTTLLQQLAPRLIEEAQISPEMVVYISMDEIALTDQPFDIVLERIIKITAATPNNPVFVLADEIGYAKHWDRVLKISFDDPERYPARVVATSSSAVEIARGVQESGAGRWVHHFLFPCHFGEQSYIARRPIQPAGFSGGTLAEILASVPQDFESDKYMREALDEFSVSGGYPEGAYQLGDSSDRAARIYGHYNNLRDVLSKVTRVDIPQMVSTSYPEKIAELLYLLAQAPCGLIELGELSSDLGITKPTTSNILEYLKDAMVVFRLPNYIGKTRKAKKICFNDNAIAAALSYMTREAMLSKVRGWALENMVAAALYELERQSHFGTRLFHYRDNGNEVDFIFYEGSDSAPLAIEVGSRFRHSRSGLKHLISRCPKFAGNSYLVTPDTTADHNSDIKTLPMAEFLLAVEYRKDMLLRERTNHIRKIS